MCPAGGVVLWRRPADPAPSETARLSMWHHARLLRRAVLLVSLLTLSGLHQQQDHPSISWRAARLLTLSVSLAHAAANLAHTATSDGAFTLLYNLVINVLILYNFFVMLHVLRHRRQMHAVLRGVAELEGLTASYRQHGDYSFVQRQTFLLVGIQVLAIVIWIVSFFIQERFEHPFYLLPALVPRFLHGPVGYWLMIGLQLVGNQCLIAFGVLLDLLLVGLTDASALLLTRLKRFCELRLNSHDVPGSDASAHEQQSIWTQGESNDGFVISKPFYASSGQSADEDPAAMRGSTPATVHISVRSQPGHTAARRRQNGPLNLPAGVCVERPSPSDDLSQGLQQLRHLYGAVSDLSSAAAAFCSLPTLGLHAFITLGLLVGLYVNVKLYRGAADPGLAVGYSVFLLLSVVRLALVSVSGSRLAERSRQLHSAVAAVRWSGPVTAETRLLLQLLLAQTRQPLGFDGWGLFVTHKQTMQSLLGFVLTYFIIMVQMSAPSRAGTGV